jgi:hypothetical protein
MRVVLLILVPCILLAGLAVLMMWLPLPPPFPESLSGARIQIAALMTGILGLGYLVGLAAYLVLAFRGAGRVLDGVLRTAGLTPAPQRLFERCYAGTVRGRSVRAEYTPARLLHPSVLNIYVTADIDQRMAAGITQPLLDCRSCRRVRLAGSPLEDLAIHSRDLVWARAFLADSVNVAPLRRLLADQAGAGRRDLYFQPGRLWLNAHVRGRATRDDVGVWLGDLLALAERAERSRWAR